VNGGWLPPDMGSGSVTPEPPPTGCTTVQPGPDWVCVNGGWLPPDMGSGSVTPEPPPTGCTTVQPGPEWVCVKGGWLPPDQVPGPPPAVATPDALVAFANAPAVALNAAPLALEAAPAAADPIASAATVELPSGADRWILRLDDGRIFVPLGNLPDAFLVDGRRVTVTGKVRIDLPSPEGTVLEILQIR
jgi:hypothetical protein